MFPGLFDSLADFDGDFHRNIKTIRVSQDLLDDLSDDPRERAFGENAAESEPSRDNLNFIIGRPFDYGVAISGESLGLPVSRFSDGTRYGVWYGSLDMETTIHETVYHWVKFIRGMKLQHAEGTEIIGERRVFLVYCNGLLVDLREKHHAFPGLVDPVNYVFCHQVGTYLHQQNQNGLLTQSARSNGVNGSVFDPSVLSNPRHQRYLTYKWRPGANMALVESEGMTMEVPIQ